MSAISISDASLEKMKDLKREIESRTRKSLSLRKLEDEVCEYVLAQKSDFIEATFSFEVEEKEKGKR